jgi:hypothetical protein
MSSRRWLAVFVAALVMPLCAAVPASAATSQQIIITVGEVWYNAGDHDLEYGPNSFLIRDYECDRFAIMVSYSWDGGTGSLGHQCGADRVVSLAPLGPDAHALQWRACYVDLRNPILGTRCLSFVEDVVFTG